MRGCAVTLMLVAACSRENPDFDATKAAGEAGSGGSATGSDARPGTDDGAPTSKSTGDPDGTSGATLADAGDATVGPATSETGVADSVGSDADTGSPTCATPAPASVGIHVFDTAGQPIPGSCDSPLQLSPGPLAVTDTGITLTPCGSCVCPRDPDPLTIELARDVDIPVLPECGTAFVWAEPVGANAVCEWVGVAVTTAGQSAPVFVASDSRTVPAAVANGATVGLAPVEECPSRSCEDTGSKALVFFDGDITMDEPPKVLQVAFAAAIEYLVDNRMSYVDDDCFEHVAWTATAL
jgi:hypothetical protein